VEFVLSRELNQEPNPTAESRPSRELNRGQDPTAEFPRSRKLNREQDQTAEFPQTLALNHQQDQPAEFPQTLALSHQLALNHDHRHNPEPKPEPTDPLLQAQTLVHLDPLPLKQLQGQSQPDPRDLNREVLRLQFLKQDHPLRQAPTRELNPSPKPTQPHKPSRLQPQGLPHALAPTPELWLRLFPPLERLAQLPLLLLLQPIPRLELALPRCRQPTLQQPPCCRVVLRLLPLSDRPLRHLHQEYLSKQELLPVVLGPKREQQQELLVPRLPRLLVFLKDLVVSVLQPYQHRLELVDLHLPLKLVV